MKKISAVMTLAATVGLGVMLLINSEQVSVAVLEAVKNCVYRIIPSLFAMTVLSTALSKSGALSYLLRNTPVDGGVLSAFILGNIGGYPIGAKVLAECSDPETAAEALPFCYSAGPAFAAGIVGAGVFGDARLGLGALLAVFLANATRYAGYLIKHKKSPAMRAAADFRPLSSELMIESVSSAAGSMLSVSAMIVFFAALKAVLYETVPLFGKNKIFSVLLEITGIAQLSPRDGINLPAAAALISFGGLCVIMQIASVVGGRFSLKKFLISRVGTAVLSAGYGYVIMKIFDSLGIACRAATKIRLSESPSLIPIICVFSMVLITLVSRRSSEE